MDAVLAKRHTLAIVPTGAGKSLCYQVPAMLMPGMTVIVSPLIALMRDQFEKLSGLGLEAVQVNSAIPAADIQRARGKIGRRAVEFVFTTPEQLAGNDLRALLGRDAVDLLVIDEAHCISQWGHDFRPAYLDAVSRLHAFGSPTILALTATATPDVVVDIERQLNVGPLCVIDTGTHRPNLAYQVRPVSSDTDKQRQLVDVVREATGSIIVYAATVRHVEALQTLFRAEGIAGASYHGRQRARPALVAYLRDHLSGSDVAVAVVHRLVSTNQRAADRPLFERLAKEFDEDRSVVCTLLNALGASGRSIKRAAGVASGAMLSVTAGGAPGELSLVRTLEGLSVGVQGRRCMWRALQNITTPGGMDFVALEAKAVRQWDAIEDRRRDLVVRTLSATAPRTE